MKMCTCEPFLIALFLFSGVVSARVILEAPSDGLDVEGYYWRDYTGSIPSDALPGGKNTNGRTTFIGQVLHKDQLIPAKIDPEEKKVYYEWGYTEFLATKNNIKILCTKHPEYFEWVSTGNGLINNISGNHLVTGGYEAGVTILIGRKQLKNELSLGKVIFTKTQSTLNTTKDGKGFQHGKFEVLTYNPNNKSAKEKKNKNDKAGAPVDNIELAYKQKSVIINVYNN